MKIKKIKEDKSTENFNTIRDAAASIDTKLDIWKVEMLIAVAMNKRKRAFKCFWNKIN